MSAPVTDDRTTTRNLALVVAVMVAVTITLIVVASLIA